MNRIIKLVPLPDFQLTPEEARQVDQAANEIAAGDYVQDSAVNWD